MFLNLRASGQKDHLHISDFDSKIVPELFPFSTGNVSPFMQSSMKIMYIFVQLSVQNINVVYTCEFFKGLG
jgi:hypothetical protein